MSSPTTVHDWYEWAFGDPYWTDYYASAYGAAEQWLQRQEPGTVSQLVTEVEALLALPTEQDRLTSIGGLLPGAGPEPGGADRFLQALLSRCLRLLAGDDGEPLADPPSDDVRQPPYDLPVLDDASRRVVHDLVGQEHDEVMRAREVMGEACTPVLRVDVPSLGLSALEVATGLVLPATVGCVVVHAKTPVLRAEPALLVSTWVEPARPAATHAIALPWLSLLFGAYYRPTWHRDFTGLADGPAVSFGLEQPAERIEHSRREIDLLLGLPDEGARRQALLSVGSSHVPVVPGRTDRLLHLVLAGMDKGAAARTRRTLGP